MAIRITRIHLAGARTHGNIDAIRWVADGSSTETSSPRAEVIQWLRETKSRAYISDGRRLLDVDVVNDDPPYLRTRADGTWTDSLLSLPDY